MVRVQKFYELQRISTPSNRQIYRHHILILLHFRLLSRQDTRLFLVWGWLALQLRIWPKQKSLTKVIGPTSSEPDCWFEWIKKIKIQK